MVELESPGSVQAEGHAQEHVGQDPPEQGEKSAPLLGVVSEAEYTQMLGGGRP